MLDTGYRISDLSNIPVIQEECGIKGKIALENTYFLGYAHSVYGINYNKQNYKIPLNTLREDIKAYIGVSSLNGSWTQGAKFWHGDWSNDLQYNKSYVWIWPESYENHEHYNPEKFNDLDNTYFIINNAPYPYETGDLNNRDKGEIESIVLEDGSVSSINMPIADADPYPVSNKIVTKEYIDKRLASERLVEVGTEFTLRDYTCTYIIRKDILKAADDIATANESDIQITITCPRSFEELALHNKITFNLLLEGEESGSIWIPAFKNNIKWNINFSDGTAANIAWISEAPRGGNEGGYLYNDVRYAAIKFTSITDNIESIEVYEEFEGENIRTGYELMPAITFNAICENALYKASGIDRIGPDEMPENFIIGNKAIIKSDDNSVLVNIESGRESSIKVDLAINPERVKLYQRSIVGDEYIKAEIDKTTDNWKLSLNPSIIDDRTEILGDNYITATQNGNTWNLTLNPEAIPSDINLSGSNGIITTHTDNNWDISLDSHLANASYVVPIAASNIITLAESYNKVYYSSTPGQLIGFDWDGIAANETVSFSLLYKTTQDTKINSPVKWAMTHDGTCPLLTANRLYSINFKCIPSINNFIDKTVIARIDWFANL